MNKRTFTVVMLIVIAALSRLFPHIDNFSPVAAIALFGGAYLGNRLLAFMVPLAALVLSDILLPNYAFQEKLITYGAFALTVLIGLQLKNNKAWYRVAGASLATSLVFFLVTNFVFFYPFSMAPLYTRDFAGVMASYTAGIPFFRYTMMSDLFYSTVLFGGYYLLTINVPALKAERISA